jgi:hypothetical protein
MNTVSTGNIACVNSAEVKVRFWSVLLCIQTYTVSCNLSLARFRAKSGIEKGRRLMDVSLSSEEAQAQANQVLIW